MDDSERVNVLKLLKGWWCFRYAQQHEQTCQSNQNTWNYAVSPVRWQSNAPHFAWNENKTKRTHTHTHMKIDWLGIRSGVCSFVCFGLIEEFNYLSSRTQQSLGIAICSNHKDYICFRLWITSCARRSRIYAMATESRKKIRWILRCHQEKFHYLKFNVAPDSRAANKRFSICSLGFALFFYSSSGIQLIVISMEFMVAVANIVRWKQTSLLKE